MADAAGPGNTRRAAGRRSGTKPTRGAPEPPATLHITPRVWERGLALHRVHLDRYAAAAFNPGHSGNARFSPISDAAGTAIPTLYGGTTFHCAAMETVFHDVPFAPGLKTLDKRKLEEQMHSVLLPQVDLMLADLCNVPLRKLGVERNRLIDTEKDTYETTRKWAVAIHAQHPRVQGLCWTSRQDDRALAAVLFGDRIAAGSLACQAPSRALLDDGLVYAELLALAEMIGVCIVSGRA